MKKNNTVRIGWVLWIDIKKHDPSNYCGRIRSANSLEFVKFGLKVSIGMPWAKTFVKYEVQNSYGKQAEGIESDNDKMMASPGFKLRMPKVRYKF